MIKISRCIALLSPFVLLDIGCIQLTTPSAIKLYVRCDSITGEPIQDAVIERRNPFLHTADAHKRKTSISFLSSAPWSAWIGSIPHNLIRLIFEFKLPDAVSKKRQ